MIAVSLINMKGGVAKTTLAVNLADCLATRHKAKVLLIDVDPQFNATQCIMKGDEYVAHLENQKDTVIHIFDRNTRPTAGTVSGPSTKEAKTLEDIEVVTAGNFDLLPGSLELYRLEMAPGDGRENRLKSYLSTIESIYDYVIIDTPPTPSVWMTSALIASKFYMIPVKADPISLTGIDLLKSIINEKKENFDLKISCAGLVLTLTEKNTNVYQSAIENLSKDEYWKNYLYNPTLPKRTKIARDQLSQSHILESGDAVSKQRLTAIVGEFIKRVNGNV